MRWWLPFLLIASEAFAFDSDELADHAERAKAAQQRGDFQRAAAEWETIVRLRPGMAEAHSNLGMMFHFAQDYPKAIAAFRGALRINPDLAPPHLFLGIDYYLTSAPAKAVPELKTATALDPASGLAHKWLAMSYFQLESFSEAARELKLAMDRDPADSELLFWLSRTYSKILFESYARIRDIAPDSAFLRRLREEPSAIRDSGAASKLEDQAIANASSPADWFARGSAAKTLALMALDDYLARSPGSYRVHQLRAEYALAEGDDDKAIQHYRDAVAADPAALQLHLAIGNLYMSRHQYAEAIPEYKAELKADSYSLGALEGIGDAYAKLNDPASAEEFLKRALAIDSHAVDALRILGKVCYERGDYKGAVANYRAAVDGSPQVSSAVLFQLSKAYRKLGNHAEADRWLARFQQELDREHRRIQERFERARQP